MFHELGQRRSVLLIEKRLHGDADGANRDKECEGEEKDEPAGKNGAVQEEQFHVHHGTEDKAVSYTHLTLPTN